MDLSKLIDRAQMLTKARHFFAERNIVEVDCPYLTKAASVDLHIDLFQAHNGGGKIGYLHSSPEYCMKRLLANGAPDIYQLGHVFRDEEKGERHNPEFTLVEWYRLGFTFEQMIEETVQFVQLFLGPLPPTSLSYREAFVRFAGIDPVTASEKELWQLLRHPYPGALEEGKDALLNLVLATIVEPHFEEIPLLVLRDYPASQAALARVALHEGIPVAKRFEIYYRGIELANGYHELSDAAEQRERFHITNEQRSVEKKELLPIDEPFLQALEKGLPDCCGVAVGFDRLMMARHPQTNINDVIPFSWERI